MRHSQDRVVAVNVVRAVEYFASEYDRLPDPGRWWLESEGVAAERLLAMLLGDASKGNPRQINFLPVREGNGKRDGLFYPAETSTLPRGLYDAYGQPFRIALNLAGEDPFPVRYDGRDVLLPGGVAAVWSVGKDGIEGTGDDGRSWQD